MKSIADLTFAERSFLFARLSQLAYENPTVVKKQARILGFTTLNFTPGKVLRHIASKPNMI